MQSLLSETFDHTDIATLPQKITVSLMEAGETAPVDTKGNFLGSVHVEITYCPMRGKDEWD